MTAAPPSTAPVSTADPAERREGTLALARALWFVAIGAARIAIGTAGCGMPGTGMLVLGGVLSFAPGLLIALELPNAAAWALGLVVGVDLIFSGALMIGLARALPVP